MIINLEDEIIVVELRLFEARVVLDQLGQGDLDFARGAALSPTGRRGKAVIRWRERVGDLKNICAQPISGGSTINTPRTTAENLLLKLICVLV